MALSGTERQTQGYVTDLDGRLVISNVVVNAETLADGADVNSGTTTDVAVAGGAAGTISAKLRRLTTDIAAMILQLPAALGAGGGLKTEGNLAIDAAASANPLMAGGRASTAVPGAVSNDGDVQANWLTRTGAQVVDGGVASAATDSGNPVKAGGVFLTNGATLTTGQRGDLQQTANGALRTSHGVVAVAAGDALSNTLGQASRTDQGGSATASTPAVVNVGIFNGTTWDRPRGNVDVALLASSSRTTTQTGADTVNYTGKGIKVVLDCTVAGTGSVTVSIQGKDANGVYYTILTGAAVTTVSTNVYTIFPGMVVAANAVANDILPRTYRVIVTANNANAMTYSVSTYVPMT